MISTSKKDSGAVKSCRTSNYNQRLAENAGDQGAIEAQGDFSPSPSFEPVRIPRQRRRGFVYFVTDEVSIKIGHSVWPLSRFKDLRSPSGQPMRMLDWFPGYMDEEHSAHRYFVDLLIGGAEWFANDQRIHDFIAKAATYREHLYAKRVTLRDLMLGTWGQITQPNDVPTTAREFEGWANRACGDLPADLQTQCYRALQGLAAGNREAFDNFILAYTKWAQP